MLEILKSDAFLLILLIAVVILIVLYIVNTIKLSKIRESYSQFMKKLGNNTNIEDDLRRFISKVEQVEQENKEIQEYANNLNSNMKGCLQKIGIVRYSAFSDVGSDLSFSIALLDSHNDGIVLTGIYSRQDSTTYAKPIDKGISRYELSEEELHVLNEAMSKE